jgi:hypothetical protein
MAHPGGRPTKYTQELADSICAQLAEGMSMRSISVDEAMPAMTTMFRWLRENDQFRQQYEKAKEEAADAFAEDMLDIADDASNDWMVVHRKDDSEAWQLNGEHVQRSRLRIDTRKWIASKLKPKKYGEKLDMTTNGKDLPTPILGGGFVPSDNSNPQDSKAD